MTSALWFVLVGVLMLTRGLTTTALERLPFTPAMLYLLVGFVMGPSVLNVFYFDPLKQSGLLMLLTEIAVLISLFSAGIKMPVPVKLADWRPPLRLAFVSMVITVAAMAMFCHWVLAMPWGAGVLLGAVLAPTDPVLATDVQSRHPGDGDQLRFTLTSEAGMNDGTAFPFVVLGLGLLGLHDLGPYAAKWFWVDAVWATLAAAVIGAGAGKAIAHLVWRLRGREQRHEILDDLVGLGLIAVVYGLSVEAHAWGFVAVFIAGVTLRQTELQLARASGLPPNLLEPLKHPDIEPPLPSLQHPTATVTRASATLSPPPIVSIESLLFKEHLERLSELMLILLLGGMLFLSFWNWRNLGLALYLLFVARPLAVMLGLVGTATPWRLRSLASWFGVRGIGSIYYLMYAIQQGLPAPLASELMQATLIVITCSILVHGISVKPLLKRWRDIASST